MKASELTPELKEFAQRLHLTYTSRGHGDKWAQRNYKITIDNKSDAIACQHIDRRKGKITYSIGKKVYKDLSVFLSDLMKHVAV